ncbi:MAG TPA: sugar ABC transporter substrate-binding protein [Candidatus Limnocylindrales bacterium]|nr:sugar ABC transporter substrate-binding protein [Candidatus Limnocylindrales bacterium]
MTAGFGRRLKAAGLVAVAAIAGAACGGSTSTGGSSSTPKIGVVLTYNLPGFWGNYLNYESQYESQLGVSLMGGPKVANVEANGNEAAQQILDIKSLIASGAQALIVNPADSAAIGPGLDYAKSKNIPVVTVDVAPSQGSVYMIVRADNTAYGSKSCDYIASHAGGAGTIAMVEGDLTSLNARDRATGCQTVIQQKYPNFKIKAYETKDWGTDPAVQNATTALTAISDLRGIYVHWSVPEDGIIAAEKQKNKYSDVGAANHVILVGNDGSPHECDLIRSKNLDATIDQPADKYAYYAIYYANQAIKGTKYSQGQSTDHNSTIVTVQGNLEDALAAPLVTLAGDNGSTQVNSTDLWCNNH